MDNREFVTKIKRYAVDDTMKQIMGSLVSPRLFDVSVEPESSIFTGLAKRMTEQNLESLRRTTWFNGLGDDGRAILQQLIQECAERTGFGFMTFIDGVGGDSEGVFEIVEVVNETRNVLNPENSDMLHDLLSEICESDRENSRL